MIVKVFDVSQNEQKARRVCEGSLRAHFVHDLSFVEKHSR